MLNLNSEQALDRARLIANLCRIGKISYDDAKSQCLPLLKIVNAHGRVLAKKYKRRWSPITFSGLAR